MTLAAETMARLKTQLALHIGDETAEYDVITTSPVRRMSAWLDRDDPAPQIGDELPAGWHTLFFPSPTPSRLLGQEGGTPHGHLLPALPLSREMWVGTRLEFFAPIRIGDEIRRVHSLSRAETKEARSGPLLFLTLCEDFYRGSDLVLREEIDLVFREDIEGAQPIPRAQPRPAEPLWSSVRTMTHPFLFQFSALTYNSHRIHYDEAYTTGKEGYPGLLVPGPLQAVLMLDLARRNIRRRIRHFACRGVRPIFAGELMTVEGAPVDNDTAQAWTTNQDGATGMTARIETQ